MRGRIEIPGVDAFGCLCLQTISIVAYVILNIQATKTYYERKRKRASAQDVGSGDAIAMDDDINHELITWAKEHLIPVAVPSSIFQLQNLPYTPSGKLDRQQLPTSDSTTPKVTIVESMEENVRRLFAKELSKQEIGWDEDFFHHGGTSVSAAFIAVHLGVSMDTIYRLRTPRRLALWLTQSVITSDVDAAANCVNRFPGTSSEIGV